MFFPQDKKWLKARHGYYDKLRNASFLFFSKRHNGHVVTRYEDVLFILKNPNLFISGQGNLIEESPSRYNKTLGASDNPTHDDIKKYVVDSYSKKSIDRIISRFNQEFTLTSDVSASLDWMAAVVLDELINAPFDSLEDLYNILRHSPTNVIEKIEHTGFKNFTDNMNRSLNNNVKAFEDGIYKEYTTKKCPYPALLYGATASGIQSLAGSLHFLTIDVANNPDQFNLVKEDPELLPAFVNESLRFNTSTARFSRTATEDVSLSQGLVEAGERVLICLEAANRDENKFVNPHSFDITRDLSGHLGFGHGVHACIALAISRAILTEYMKILLKRNESLKLKQKEPDYVLTTSGNFNLISNLELEDD